MKSQAAAAPAIGDTVLTLGASHSVQEGIRTIGESTEKNEAARATKNEQHDRLRAKAANRQAAAAEPVAPLVAHEEVASVEIEMPDGRVIMLERPPAGTMNLRIAVALGDQAGSIMLNNIARALVHVAKVDDEPVGVIQSKVDFVKLQNDLGEDAIDAVVHTVNTTWPWFDISKLLIVKKTLKT